MSSFTTGWIDSPQEVARFQATLPQQSFADTLAYASGPDRGRSVYLWRLVAKARGMRPGERIRSRNQGSVGSCVGHGTAGAIEVTAACDVYLHGQAEVIKYLPAADALYWYGRKLNGRERGGDGSTGSWACDAVLDCIPYMRPYDGVDLSTYSISVCRNGVPASVVEQWRADNTKSMKVVPVRTTDEAIAALQSGYGFNICSNQGFSMKRDQDGYARPSGSWAHSMFVWGYWADKGWFRIQNSWGDTWISGPDSPEDAPLGGFWCDEQTMARILRQGDSYAYADFKGFERRFFDPNAAFANWG